MTAPFRLAVPDPERAPPSVRETLGAIEGERAPKLGTVARWLEGDEELVRLALIDRLPDWIATRRWDVAAPEEVPGWIVAALRERAVGRARHEGALWTPELDRYARRCLVRWEGDVSAGDDGPAYPEGVAERLAALGGWLAGPPEPEAVDRLLAAEALEVHLLVAARCPSLTAEQIRRLAARDRRSGVAPWGSVGPALGARELADARQMARRYEQLSGHRTIRDALLSNRGLGPEALVALYEAGPLSDAHVVQLARHPSASPGLLWDIAEDYGELGPEARTELCRVRAFVGEAGVRERLLGACSLPDLRTYVLPRADEDEPRVVAAMLDYGLHGAITLTNLLRRGRRFRRASLRVMLTGDHAALREAALRTLGQGHTLEQGPLSR